MATFLTTAPGIDGDNDITNSPLEKLTPREREVLTLIGQGMSLMDIADRLHRGYATIKSHRLMLGRKLGVTNRVELARIAIQTGLSPLENLPGSGDMKTADASLVSNVDAEKALLSIEKGIAHKSGAAYFAALVEHLAKALHVKCVFLGRLLDPHSTIIRSIAVWLDNSPAENFEFDFKGTPCEKVIRERLYFCTTEVSKSFPDSPRITNFRPDAYVGAAVLSRPGQPIGILAVINDSPMELGFESQAILRIFAGHAAMEMEALRSEKSSPAA